MLKAIQFHIRVKVFQGDFVNAFYRVQLFMCYMYI